MTIADMQRSAASGLDRDETRLLILPESAESVGLMRDPRMEILGRLSGGRSSILVGEAVPIANGARIPAAKSPASRIPGGRCHSPHRENLQQRLFR
jgi:hypothetical protein